MHGGRTGRHNHPVQMLLLDVLHDKVLPGIRTHVGVGPRDDNVGLFFGKPTHRLDIHMVRNVDPTVADIDTNPHAEPLARPLASHIHDRAAAPLAWATVSGMSLGL